MSIGNLSAVEIAKQRAERSGGGGSLNFFKLDEGQTTYLRFLTGMINSKVVSHSCGLAMYDYNMARWNDEEAAGQPHLCPNCQQPLTDSDVLYDRPEPLAVDIHNYFPTSEADKHRSFMCLASEANASRGIVPANEDGSPKYKCPACTCTYNINKETKKPRKPSFKLYGIAVEREVIMENEMRNGIMTPVIKGVKDVMVEEDGKLHPKIVIVQMSWMNFWQKLSNFDNSYERSITLYDWSVQRQGSGLNTTYDLQAINQNEPSAVDMREYEEWIPDVKKMLQAQGDPEYYVKNGYQVEGYVSADTPVNAAGTAQAAIENAARNAAGMQNSVQQAERENQPFVPQQAQGGSNDWTAVQNQFS